MLAAAGLVTGLVAGQGALDRLPLVGLAVLAVTVAPLTRLLPAGTLRGKRGLPAAVLTRGLVAGAFFGGEAFLPLLLVSGLGISPSAAGWALAAGAIGWSAGSWSSSRSSRHRGCAAMGGLLVAAGLAAAACAGRSVAGYTVAITGWGIAGLGIGLALTSVNLIAVDLGAAEGIGGTAARLQLSEAFFSILFISLTGTMMMALHHLSMAAAPIRVGIALLCIPALLAGVTALRADIARTDRNTEPPPDGSGAVE